jgi:hypothetical protein
MTRIKKLSTMVIASIGVATLIALGAGAPPSAIDVAEASCLGKICRSVRSNKVINVKKTTNVQGDELRRCYAGKGGTCSFNFTTSVSTTINTAFGVSPSWVSAQVGIGGTGSGS